MMQYNIVKFADGKQVLTAFVNGEMYSMVDTHPAFSKAAQMVMDNDESVVDVFDLANLASKAFHSVTDRVSVRNGVVYLDESPVDSAMSKVIVDYLMEGNDNALPLVLFLERLDRNPSFTSRNQLWDFVRTHGIHIADDGRMVLYKGVNPANEDGLYKSVSSGRAFVNGEEQNGQIHTRAGDVVTMPRREISDDPTVACHAGLHCGARSYAQSFAKVLITTLVGPEHVVCVPRDSSSAKVRVEEYEIMQPLGDREVNTVRWSDDRTHADDDEFEDYDVWSDSWDD